jgi:hypothetical protein
MHGMRKEGGERENAKADAEHQLAYITNLKLQEYIPDLATRREGRCRLIVMVFALHQIIFFVATRVVVYGSLVT